jgi:hypothetical protein
VVDHPLEAMTKPVFEAVLPSESMSAISGKGDGHHNCHHYNDYTQSHEHLFHGYSPYRMGS